MEIKRELLQQDAYTTVLRWSVMDDDGVTKVSGGATSILDSRYAGHYLRTLTIGGIGTPPEYRRRGYVRMMFDQMLAYGQEQGCAIAMLHPFSFAYYRMFGFEKISDHKQLTFPMSALNCFPRYKDFVPVQSEAQLPDLLKVFDGFAKNRNIMFRRYDGSRFTLTPARERTTYLYYLDGEPVAYAVLGIENHYEINRMVSDNLHLYEFAYTCPKGLQMVIGSLRMFEGQLESVKVHDWAMAPEFDGALRNYNHTKYTDYADIAARVLDTAAMLRANVYPKQPGSFTLRVEDSLPGVGGVYGVTFGSETKVETLTGTAAADLTVPAPALSQLLYGYQPYSAETAAYLPGVTVANPESDFFRAFPARPAGLFEHF